MRQSLPPSPDVSSEEAAERNPQSSCERTTSVRHAQFSRPKGLGRISIFTLQLSIPEGTLLRIERVHSLVVDPFRKDGDSKCSLGFAERGAKGIFCT